MSCDHSPDHDHDDDDVHSGLDDRDGPFLRDLDDKDVLELPHGVVVVRNYLNEVRYLTVANITRSKFLFVQNTYDICEQKSASCARH